LRKYIWAFIVKFVGVGVLTFSLFGVFFHATIDRLFLMTFVVAGVTFIGDVFILPRLNQAVAAVGDFIGYAVLYYILGNLVVEATVPLLLPALTAAYFAGLAEMIYHIYVMDRLHEEPRTAPLPTRFQTEVAEEISPETEARKKEDIRDDEAEAKE